MKGKNGAQKLGMAIGLVLMVITLCGVVGSPIPIWEVPLARASFLYEPDHYGTVYMYESLTSAWDPEDLDDMEAALTFAKSLGFDTVIQTFPAGLLGSGDEAHWRLFLDAAQTVGVDVVAYLWPSNTYTGNPDAPFYYDDLKAFLNVVSDHPALLGYVGLHEPLEPRAGIDGDEFRAFYTEMKTHAPGLKIAHFLGNMAYWDERREDWSLSDGMCDICMIWYYPFRYVDGDPVYERDLIMPVVQPNVALVAERDPDAQVWFLGQAFARSAHPRDLRMPTPEEMEDLYLLVMQEPVDGFLWYPWYHTEAMADGSLGDPGMEDQQEMAGDIVETHTDYADLEISKAVSPIDGILYPGDSVTYTLVFTNYGPHVAQNTVITDLIPSVLFTPTVVNSSGAAITATDGIAFAWTVDPLQVGDSGIITMTGVISPGLTISTNIANTVEITAPVAQDNGLLSATATVFVSYPPPSPPRKLFYLPLVMKNW